MKQAYVEYNSRVLNRPGRGLPALHPRRAPLYSQSHHRLWTSRVWPVVVYRNCKSEAAELLIKIK